MESTIMTTVLTSRSAVVAYDHPAPKAPAGEWACAGIDPDLFFPTDEDQLALARDICSSCVLRETCLSLGQARAESGVWGGVLLDRGKTLERVPVMGRPRKVVA